MTYLLCFFFIIPTGQILPYCITFANIFLSTYTDLYEIVVFCCSLYLPAKFERSIPENPVWQNKLLQIHSMSWKVHTLNKKEIYIVSTLPVFYQNEITNLNTITSFVCIICIKLLYVYANIISLHIFYVEQAFFFFLIQ